MLYLSLCYIVSLKKHNSGIRAWFGERVKTREVKSKTESDIELVAVAFIFLFHLDNHLSLALMVIMIIGAC